MREPPPQPMCWSDAAVQSGGRVPRPSLCPTFLSASVLLGGLNVATTLDAQTRPARVELAPSTAPDTAAKASPDADAARPSHTVAGDAAARVSGPWATTVLLRAVAPATAGAVTHQQDGPHVGAGKNLAIMGVGAAAVAVGPLVGDATGVMRRALGSRSAAVCSACTASTCSSGGARGSNTAPAATRRCHSGPARVGQYQ